MNTERIRNLDSPEAAEFFISPQSSRHLEPFLRGECSLSEAAQALALSKSRMSYWLAKLLQLELIEQVRIEKRGKHKVPIYRASAEVFRIPFDQIPAESDEQVLEINTRGFEEAVRVAVIRKAKEHANEWYLEYRFLYGKAQHNFMPKAKLDKDPPFIFAFGNIRLSNEVAEAAQRDLQAFLDRYGAENSSEGKSYLFKFLMVEQVS
jgi:DNA-binding transcriptional ArsR family regulator